MGEHLEPNSQMELVGHSIVLTSYPYSEPHYGGLMAYGAQVHPHLLGLQQTRMPLPLDMEEEPVYVNAKQYHGILRRRQTRAKLELEKKVIKDRKPYLHESRHQHAMRRARGCGGRFLNTKKLDDNGPNSPSEKEPKSGATVSTQSANSSASDHWPLNSSRNLNGPMFQGMHNGHNSSNGNMNGHGWVYELSLIRGNSFLRQIILGFGYSCVSERGVNLGEEIYMPSFLQSSPCL